MANKEQTIEAIMKKYEDWGICISPGFAELILNGDNFDWSKLVSGAAELE